MKINGAIANYYQLFFIETPWGFSTPSKAKWRNDAISINQLYMLLSEKAFLVRFSLYKKLLQEFFSIFFIRPYRILTDLPVFGLVPTLVKLSISDYNHKE